MHPTRCVLLLLTAIPLAATTYDFVTFAGPAGANLSPVSINNSGQVAGSFTDSAGVSHGFLRSADGQTFTAIDIPGATSTAVVSLNNAAWVTGTFVDGKGTHGFVRSPDGAGLTTIDAPGSSYTTPKKISNTQWVVGGFQDSGGSHGFLLAPDGKTITTFDVSPGITFPTSMNDLGEVVGYLYSEDERDGWMRDAAGNSSLIGGWPLAINNTGAIVGQYGDFPNYEPFLLSPGNSTATIMEATGAKDTGAATGINSGGTIIGAFGNNYSVRNPDGTFAAPAVPRASNFSINAIDDSGQITGSFSRLDSSGVAHNFGFVAQPMSPGRGPSMRSYYGVTTAAAFGGTAAIAPGTWVEIYGENLASSSRSWAASDFTGNSAPTSLDGVTVQIGGQAAFVSYVSPTQVNALVPMSVAPGAAAVTVTNGSVTTPPQMVAVNAFQPGWLTTSFGSGMLLASFPDGTYVWFNGIDLSLPSRAAQVGDTVLLYGTGLGPVLPAGLDGRIVGQPNNLQATLQILNGPAPFTPVTVTYAGLAPGFVDLYQVNIVVPSVSFVQGSPISCTQLYFTLNGSTAVPMGGFAVGQ